MQPCKKCGGEKTKRPTQPGYVCRPCAAEYNKAYAVANREKLTANVRERRRANPVPHRAQVLAYQSANPEKARARKSKWKRNHPENARNYAREATARLTNAYVASSLNLPVSAIPPALIELHRAHIQIKRYLKNGNH